MRTSVIRILSFKIINWYCICEVPWFCFLPYIYVIS